MLTDYALVCRSMVTKALSWKLTRLPSGRGGQHSATVNINGVLHTKVEVEVRDHTYIAHLMC